MLRYDGSGAEVLGGGLNGFPVVGEEFFEPFNRMRADAVEDVAEVGERVDLEPFAGLDEASASSHLNLRV
jgi:hypothetical protein